MPENNPLSGTSEVVAEAIRNALAEAKKSGRQLAHEIGMPRSNLSRRMTGEVDFTIDELAAIAAALDIPLSALVEEAATPAGAA